MSGASRHDGVVWLVTVALTAACLSVLSPWSIPIGGVPLTLATLGVMLAGAVFGTARGASAVAVYLAVGAVGVPVFASFGGGVGHLLSPTGGFLIGYLACVSIVGISKRCRKTWLLPVMASLGMLACYAIGTVWYGVVAGVTFPAACAAGILPFLPFDAGKIIAVTLLAPPLKRACARYNI